MPELIASCGLDCTKCEAYIATRDVDDAAREEIAKKWSAMYGGKCTADDCICEGCTTGGLLSTAHANTCAIRICVESNDLPTCAHCEDYICDKLAEFLKFMPESEEALDVIHEELGD